MKIQTLLLLTLFTAFSCGSLDRPIIKDRELHDFHKAPLLGMVYQRDNQPCAGVKVLLCRIRKDEDRKEKVLFETQTDLSGRFILPDVKKGINRIVLVKEDFEKAEIEFDFNSPSQIFYLQMSSLHDLIGMTEDSFDLQKWDEGHKYLLRALAVNENSLPAKLLLAVYYSSRGNMAKGQEILEAAGISNTKEGEGL